MIETKVLEIYLSDEMYLPIQYKELVNRPNFKGVGSHTITQLEHLCQNFEDYVHQQEIIKQSLKKIVIRNKFNVDIDKYNLQEFDIYHAVPIETENYVYAGTVGAFDLEDAFVRSQNGLHSDLGWNDFQSITEGVSPARSTSVGDIIYDKENSWLVEGIGFKKILWQPTNEPNF